MPARTVASDSKSEHVAELYDHVARSYDRWIRIPEKLFFGGGREWVASRARGDVLELGIGTGRTLPYYGKDVRLTGIEISPEMLSRARERLRELERPATLELGDAQRLRFPDESFDTVVFALALCTIPDELQAIREAKRVLRPGGQVLCLEHVRSPYIVVRTIQRCLERITLRLMEDHLLREPLDALRAEGFLVEELERSRLGIVEKVRARKPER